jgi:hypothetical protein
MANICCSPPLSLPPIDSRRACRTGNVSITRSSESSSSCPPRCGPAAPPLHPQRRSGIRPARCDYGHSTYECCRRSTYRFFGRRRTTAGRVQPCSGVSSRFWWVTWPAGRSAAPGGRYALLPESRCGLSTVKV